MYLLRGTLSSLNLFCYFYFSTIGKMSRSKTQRRRVFFLFLIGYYRGQQKESETRRLFILPRRASYIINIMPFTKLDWIVFAQLSNCKGLLKKWALGCVQNELECGITQPRACLSSQLCTFLLSIFSPEHFHFQVLGQRQD